MPRKQPQTGKNRRCEKRNRQVILGQTLSPRIRRTGLDRAVTVASDPAVVRIEQMLTDILPRTEALLSQEEVIDLPEVFDLQPLARRRVSIKIASVKAATFQFAPEDDLSQSFARFFMRVGLPQDIELP